MRPPFGFPPVPPPLPPPPADPVRRRRLVSYIRRRHAGHVTCRDIMRRKLGFMNTAEVRAELDNMAAAGLGRWKHPQPGRRGGRPSEIFVLRLRLHRYRRRAGVYPL